MNRANAAKKAIDQLGGPTKAAHKLADITGKPITVDQVKKWKRRGIAARWAHIVSACTGIGLGELLEGK